MTRLYLMFVQIRCLVILALLCAADAAAHAAIVANFTGGDGTVSSDQWTGATGNGWASVWASAGNTTGTGVVSTTPLSGGGNYLQFVDNTTTSPAYVRRQYQSFGDVDITQTYRISMSFRFDGSLGDFTNFNDRIAIFGDTTGITSSTTTNTWLLGVAGSNTGAGTGQSVFPGNWYIFDNNGSTNFATSNMVDTNLALVAGRVYDIAIDVNAALGTYSASINDGVNPIFTASDLTFRRGAGAVTSNFLHVSMNANAAADNSAFSIDNISISAIPEPAGITAILSACLGTGWIFGKRLRKKMTSV